MASCDAQSLLTASCKFDCLNSRQLEVVKAQLLCAILYSNPMASCDAQTLLTAGKHFDQIGTKQLSVIQTQLLCEILQAGGGGSGGATCILCGTIDPVDAPATCSCALYYRTNNGGVWFWDNAGAGAWVSLIAA